MGSKSMQGKLWGQKPQDWATIQEPTGNAGYMYALDFLKLKTGDRLLDVGCGSGMFSNLASLQGADVTGIDASDALIEQAKQRNPSIEFLSAEMEDLPFPDNAFDVVCGFNSFQYAASTENALRDAKRVLKSGGKIVTMIWGNQYDCEAAVYLKAVGSLLPPPPPGAPGPFALSENQLLEEILTTVGFKVIIHDDIESVWNYSDVDTALKGLMSAGPVARAIENSGFDKARNVISAAIAPYIQPDGHIIFRNKFRMVIAEK